jgi:prepilin-type processing-associated H-X9-DG protein
MIDPSPSMTWVLIDERQDSINNGQMFHYMDSIYPTKPKQWGWVNWPANYHGGSGGLNFADGHAEIRKWRDGRTTPPFKPGVDIFRIWPAYVPSPNNQDCYWLGLRTAGLR